MNGLPVVVAAFEFRFIGGSMGSVVGERFVQGVRRAVADNCSFLFAWRLWWCAYAGGFELFDADDENQRGLHLLTENVCRLFPY